MLKDDIIGVLKVVVTVVAAAFFYAEWHAPSRTCCAIFQRGGSRAPGISAPDDVVVNVDRVHGLAVPVTRRSVGLWAPCWGQTDRRAEGGLPPTRSAVETMMTADTAGVLCDGPEAEHLRATERRCLRALVEATVDIRQPSC